VIEARFTDHSIFDYPRGVSEVYSWFRLAPERSSDVVRGLTYGDDCLFMRFVGMFVNLQLGASFRPTPMDLKTLAAIWPMKDIGARLERIEAAAEGEPANGARRLHALWQEQMNIINPPDVEDKADDAEVPEGWAVVTDDIVGDGQESTGTRRAWTGDFEDLPIVEGS